MRRNDGSSNGPTPRRLKERFTSPSSSTEHATRPPAPVSDYRHLKSIALSRLTADCVSLCFTRSQPLAVLTSRFFPPTPSLSRERPYQKKHSTKLFVNTILGFFRLLVSAGYLETPCLQKITRFCQVGNVWSVISATGS